MLYILWIFLKVWQDLSIKTMLTLVLSDRFVATYSKGVADYKTLNLFQVNFRICILVGIHFDQIFKVIHTKIFSLFVYISAHSEVFLIHINFI